MFKEGTRSQFGHSVDKWDEATDEQLKAQSKLVPHCLVQHIHSTQHAAHGTRHSMAVSLLQCPVYDSQVIAMPCVWQLRSEEVVIPKRKKLDEWDTALDTGKLKKVLYCCNVCGPMCVVHCVCSTVPLCAPLLCAPLFQYILVNTPSNYNDCSRMVRSRQRKKTKPRRVTIRSKSSSMPMQESQRGLKATVVAMRRKVRVAARARAAKAARAARARAVTRARAKAKVRAKERARAKARARARVKAKARAKAKVHNVQTSECLLRWSLTTSTSDFPSMSFGVLL